MYSGAVAERRGATVHRHSWSQEPPNPFEPEIEGWSAPMSAMCSTSDVTMALLTAPTLVEGVAIPELMTA